MKVRWGLENVHYAKKTASGYDTPVAVPGAVSITGEAEGDEYKFYADNVVYFTTTTNNGRSGDLEIAMMSAQMKVDLLGYEIDDNGAVVEMSDGVASEFALIYDVLNDTGKKTHFVLYDVKLGRANDDHSTQEEQSEPQTETYSYTAVPMEIDWEDGKRKAVGAYLDYSTTAATAYNGWFTQVYMPTKTAESGLSA